MVDTQLLVLAYFWYNVIGIVIIGGIVSDVKHKSYKHYKRGHLLLIPLFPLSVVAIVVGLSGFGLLVMCFNKVKHTRVYKWFDKDL